MASNILKLAHGRPCPYCARAMDRHDFDESGFPGDLQPTRDHHPVPKSKGGTRIIIVCMRCNSIKGDMTAVEWAAYMLANPGWWLMTKVDRRTRRAAAREAARTERWGPRGQRVIRQAEAPSTPLAAGLAPLSERMQADFDRIFGEPTDGDDP